MSGLVIQQQHRLIAELWEMQGKTNSFAHFMVANGQAYPTGPATYKGKRAQKHQCYRNAGRLARDNAALTYVEGQIGVHGVPIGHAWVIDSTGTVIDPTIRHSVAPYIDGYFGIPFKSSYLEKVRLATHYWGVLCDFSPSLYALVTGAETDFRA